MKLFNLKIILFFFVCLQLIGLNAQNIDSEYEAKNYITPQGDTLRYRELKPEKIQEGTTYPLVIFLHGSGERGSDNTAQLTHGAKMFTNPVNREKFPAYVIFPQCPKDAYWAMPTRPKNFVEGEPFPLNAPMSKPLGLVEQLLHKIVIDYPIDMNRIYIVGLSMGGMGTFDFVCRNPNLFAAAVPICGGIHVQRLSNLQSKTAFRIFHGDADSVVPVTFSREAYLMLKATGANVEYIEFPGVNHGSWQPAFNRDDFMTWLFQQKIEK